MKANRFTIYVTNRAHTISASPVRTLVAAIVIATTFALGAVSGIAYDHKASRQSMSGETTSTQPDSKTIQRERQWRDDAVKAVRASRIRTGQSLDAACRNPRSSTRETASGPEAEGFSYPAALSALYDVERYNAALHEYGDPSDQFPAMTYRPVGIYSRAGAQLSYFTDGSGQVQRDPLLDSKAAVYQLDWCRSLADFNAS